MTIRSKSLLKTTTASRQNFRSHSPLGTPVLAGVYIARTCGMILHVQKICYLAFANVRRANITNDPELVQTRVHFRRGHARAQTHGKGSSSLL